MKIIKVDRFVTKSFHAAEAIKTLRTNILFNGKSIKSVALTSYSGSEGKSTISFQLAASMAQNGKRVLLLDADIRKSVLVNRLKVGEQVKGLSHYLSGMASVEELLCETDVKGLFIIFAGPRVPNAAELLGGRNFGELITALKGVFDYTIVDAPPLGQVIDCAVLAPAIDGVLMVVDATNNSYKLERRMKMQLEKAGGKILGVVLNRVNFKEKRGYYGKKYGYGYGYGSEK